MRKEANLNGSCLLVVIGLTIFSFTYSTAQSIEKIPEEKNGLLVVEAEHYDEQDFTVQRKWELMTPEQIETPATDPDRNHSSTASNHAYLEILPDSRTNHDEELIRGVNFSNKPGIIGVLRYRVKINQPGRYFVWVRAYSTGTEDNGIHVGLNGAWPESGQRMQWCEGKDRWTWASKQRTAEVHCGVEKLIYLDIDKAGEHDVMFSMREDGFEFDQWALTREYKVPE